MEGLTVSLKSHADEETISNCPLLLTPSPSSADFQHPLAIPTTPVLEYDRAISPSSMDTEISSCPPVSTNMDFAQENIAKDPVARQAALEGSSSSSSCSVMQDSAASAQLLNSRNYLSLASDVNCQENGGIKGSGMAGLTLGKSTQEFGFTSWNWPLIRRCCFWGVASVTVACVCIIIAYITTIPTKCDPPRAWYQGTLIYQVFPASFQDSDGNGVGDLKGLEGRLDWIASLGAKGLRLSALFPSPHYPEAYYDHVLNLTQVEPSLGNLSDLQSLVRALHSRNMSLILDLPLHPFYEELKTREPLSKPGETIKHVIVNNHILVSAVNRSKSFGSERGEVTDVMAFWMHQGVDGFYLLGLHNFVNDDNFLMQVEEWRQEMYRAGHGDSPEKILICSEEVLSALDEVTTLQAEEKNRTVLAAFDLVDYRLDPFVEGTRSIAKKLKNVLDGSLYRAPGRPWPYWTLGTLTTRRLATKAPEANLTLGALLTAMMLPGTGGLLYGDEIGLQDINDPEGERVDLAEVHGLSPMQWSTGGGFTRGNLLGWLPHASRSLLKTLGPQSISRMSTIKEINPSVYMHGLWSNNKLQSNAAIRFVDNEVVALERTYPRRHTFLLVANLSPNQVTRDLSSLYYGGTVVLDTSGSPGAYVTFQRLSLGPGHSIVAKLDR